MKLSTFLTSVALLLLSSPLPTVASLPNSSPFPWLSSTFPISGRAAFLLNELTLNSNSSIAADVTTPEHRLALLAVDLNAASQAILQSRGGSLPLPLRFGRAAVQPVFKDPSIPYEALGIEGDDHAKKGGVASGEEPPCGEEKDYISAGWSFSQWGCESVPAASLEECQSLCPPSSLLAASSDVSLVFVGAFEKEASYCADLTTFTVPTSQTRCASAKPGQDEIVAAAPGLTAVSMTCPGVCLVGACLVGAWIGVVAAILHVRHTAITVRACDRFQCLFRARALLFFLLSVALYS